jgi:hypothetical protein
MSWQRKCGGDLYGTEVSTRVNVRADNCECGPISRRRDYEQATKATGEKK